MALSLDAWKALSMAVFTVISVIGAAIAVVMKENTNQLYVTSGVLFSAGVLLAGGFVHLLADSNEQFLDIGVDGFPWANAISGFTILCLACFEMALTRALGGHVHAHQGDDNSRGIETISLTAGTAENGYNILDVDAQRKSQAIREAHDHLVESENPFSAIILSIALDIHCIIEGMGIGASTDLQQFVTTFIAIAIHKGFVAFALAQGMVSSGYWADPEKRKYFYISIGTFTFVTLLGIAIGWGISSISDANAVFAILSGITSGTFIFVALIEILPQEAKAIKRERVSVLRVVFFFLAGYCLMALLGLWA